MTARLIGVACLVLGVFRAAGAILQILAGPTPDAGFFLMGTERWADFVYLPASMLLLAGGTALVFGQRWGRYPALLYFVLDLGLTVATLLFMVLSLTAFQNFGPALGTTPNTAFYMFGLLTGRTLPSLFLFVILTTPTRGSLESAPDSFEASETARAEIVRLGWLSAALGALAFAFVLANAAHLYFLALATQQSGTAANIDMPRWVPLSLGGHALADILLVAAGIGLLRFRHWSKSFALAQGAISLALLALLVAAFTGKDGTGSLTSLASLAKTLETFVQAKVPPLFVAAWIILPHIQRRLGRPGKTIDGQPIMNENEMSLLP